MPEPMISQHGQFWSRDDTEFVVGASNFTVTFHLITAIYPRRTGSIWRGGGILVRMNRLGQICLLMQAMINGKLRFRQWVLTDSLVKREWNHVIVSCKRDAGVVAYVNGIRLSIQDASIAEGHSLVGDGRLHIRGHTNDVGNYQLEKIGFWKTYFTEAFAEGLYNNGNPLLAAQIPAAGRVDLVEYYNGDEA